MFAVLNLIFSGKSQLHVNLHSGGDTFVLTDHNVKGGNVLIIFVFH